MRTFLLSLIALSSFGRHAAWAQNNAAWQKANFNPRFEVFDLPGEMLGNHVQHIVQDSVGFLWFASRQGLHRYDGRHIKTYRHDPLDTNSLASDYVEWIHLDRHEQLWLGHFGDGLTVFDPARETFTRYAHEPANPNSLSDNTVSVIAEDRNGNIWVGTHNGLNRFDRKTNTFKRYYHNPDDPGSLSYNLVRALYVDRQGALWVGCGFPWDDSDPEGKLGGLNRLNPDARSFTRYLHNPADPNSLADNRVRALFEDSRGNFWVGTAGEGLHLMDREKGTFRRLPFNPDRPDALGRPCLRDPKERQRQPFIQVTAILEDLDGRIWISSCNGGLNVYDPRYNYTRHFEHEETPGDLQTNFIWNICRTRDGTLWLAGGISGGVVMKVKENRVAFPFFPHAELREEKDYKSALVEDDKGNLWLGAENSRTPLTCFNRKTGEVSYIYNGTAPGEIQAANVSSLYKDREGFIWACTDNGLVQVDPDKGVVRHYKPRPGEDGSLSHHKVSAAVQDRQGYLWVATMGGGINRLDPLTGIFTHYRHNPADPLTIASDYIYKLLEDPGGDIWLGGGKSVHDEDLRLFVQRLNPRSGRIDLVHMSAQASENALLQTVSGDDLWLMGLPFGLKKLNKTTRQLSSLTSANHPLLSEQLRSIQAAPDGNLWITTSSAIIKYDPEHQAFYNYNKAHGVRIGHIAHNAYFISARGEHFVCGEDGFHAFFPEQIAGHQKKDPPTIRITGLFLANKLVEPGDDSILNQPVWNTEEIHLSYDQNTFSFSLACFDFHFPSNNLLEYRLDNYDESWRSDLYDGKAAYFKIPPGEYTFRVRGANSMGIWDSEGVRLRLIILPPWWQTWWAYLLYAILALSLVYGAYRFLVNRRLAEAEARRLRELDLVKTRLYTNITHEFRTPLTVIAGMADQIGNDPEAWLDEGLRMIKRNSSRLLTLVNQMLDLAKLENGRITLHLQQGDVVNYLRYLSESFHSYAESRGVQIHFLSDLDALTMDYDPERLQQIIVNLLSNAVKFTPPGGHVYLNIRLAGNVASVKNGPGSMASLVIRVRDTGIGIPEDQLPFVFDRFYQATVPSMAGKRTQSPGWGGAGIGLALTRELVHLMEGSISVKSRPDKGSEFTLSLPVRHAAAPVVEPADHTAGIVSYTDASPAPTQVSSVRENDAPPADDQTTILLAEDNPDVVAYLASCLSGAYRLAVAKDGQEALDIALETIPDLIITDVMMPRKDGFEVCRTLKNDHRTSHIPVIMLTAKADVDSKLEGLEYGADAYLAKPFHKTELLIRIRKLLELRQQLRHHYRLTAGLTGDAPARNRDIPALPDGEDQFIRKVRDIVESHLDDGNFDVEQLCRTLAMSHSQVHRKLSALTGFSATRFIRYVRLNRAKDMLQNQALSIMAVAFDTGFNDPSYFSRVFKQEVGVTPQEWREQRVEM